MPQVMFAEVNGGYGVQFGETDYLPGDEGPLDWKYPIVHGPAVGGTAGFFLGDNVALFANYEYIWATTQTIEIEGVADEFQGTLDYHTLTAGLRLYVPVGFGRLRSEFALGVAFPYTKRLEIMYSQALAPAGITGIGEREENFSIGFGGHAMIGYELPIVPGVYLAFNLKYKLFESENSGETTEFRNFLDLEGLAAGGPPTVVDATIPHGDGAARPMTDSVQEVRFQLSLGVGF
jgi:hypothetical protein